MKIDMFKNILQKIGDFIIDRIKNANEPDLVNFYYELGMWFNDFCINDLSIYLD